ncbi:procathepsin L-like [Drosophila sulfurigaster albostrigata]|uniref:procathepsin L-like n=1 Tax=Drosophila sulfurigaster albostrigata TaxID=89887 RepID=UPI002D21EB25|nr:procathepsin L-like [Drosophila sulfurigaster albostrigata]
MKAVILILVLVAVVHATSLKDILKAEFNAFKLKHRKSYKDASEELKRLQNFVENKKLIDSHNKRYAAGEVSYEMGINQFSDLNSKEFQKTVLSSINANDLTIGITQIFTPSTSVQIPGSIDWREKGAVTRVKDQGGCGSCWAFSAIGTLEGQNFIKNRQLISLSEQNLIDCSKENGGCDGGWPETALNFIKNNGGVDTEDSYPYEERDGECRFNAENIGAKVTGTVGVASGDESALAAAVAEKGPISVAVDASQFQNYQGGVFDEPSCQDDVNHGVVVVGYGRDDIGGDYWLVKNSWSESWGESGYIRIARNKNNQCKIADHGVYPLV